MKPFRKNPLIVALAVLPLAPHATRANTLYWDAGGAADTTSWGYASSWSTDADGMTDPLTIPGASDDLVFHIARLWATYASLDANRVANSLTFNSSGGATLFANLSGATSRNLTLGAGGITVNAGAGAILLGAAPTVLGNLSFNVNTSQTWKNNSTNGLFLYSNSNTGVIIGFGQLLTFDGTGPIQIGQSTSTANIGGSGGIVKNGTGTLTLYGNSGFFGGTTLNSGVLSLGHASALGTGALTITGGTLDSAKTSLSNSQNNAQNWKGDFTFAGTNNLNLGTGVVAMNANRRITVNGNSLTVGGNISGSGYSLTKAGAGQLTLSGTNSYTGGTVLEAGTLSINSAGALGTGGTLTINGGSLRPEANTSRDLTGKLSGITVNADFAIGGGSGTLTLDAPVNLGVARRTITVNGATNLNGVISGSVGLIKAGAGTLTIGGTAAHNLTDGLIINGGLVTVNYANYAADNLLGSSNAVTVGSGGFGVTTGTSVVNQTVNGVTLSGGSAAINFNSSTAGSTLALGSINRNNQATLNFTLPSSGSITTTATLGPWATTGFGTGSQYASVIGGKVVSITGTPAIDGTGLSDLTGTANYDLTAGGGTVPASMSTNTIRFIGTAAGTTTPGSTLFSANGLMNNSTNLWTIGAGTLTIGSTKELVVYCPNTGSIALGGVVIANNGANPSDLTLAGNSTALGAITLNANNSFTGTATINGGFGGSIPGDSAATITLSSALGNAGSNSQLGAGNTVCLNGAVIKLNGTAGSTSRNFTISGNSGFYTLGANYTVNGQISGTGNLYVDSNNGGSLTLTNQNSFTGDVFFVTDGKLNVNHANSLMNATLNLAGQRVSTLLNGNHAFNIGGLKGNAGDLALGTGTASGGDGKITIGSNNRSNAFWGSLSGTAGLIKTGSGTQTLGKTTYTGDTIIQSGTLKIGSVSQYAPTSMAVSQDGTLGKAKITIAGSNVHGFAVGQVVRIPGEAANEIWGIGSDTSSTYIYLKNPLIGGTYAGTIDAMNGTIASSNIEVKAAGNLEVSPQSAQTMSNAISGGGTFTKTGVGALTLTGSNIYTGNTTIGAGTLTIGGSGVLGNGNYAGAIANDGEVIFSSSADQTLTGVISGSGNLTHSGSGTLTLTGSNTYSGGTILSGGTLAFANGSPGTTGSITMNGGALQWTAGNKQDPSSRLIFVNGTAATFDTNGNNITFASSIGNATTGGLTKTGAGNLTLPAASTYTGKTTVSQGTLTLTGSGSISSASTIEVKPGAFLDVSGIVGGYTLGSTQTLSGTGNVNGGMTVAGTLSPGNLATGSQTWVNGGNYNWQMLDATGTVGTGYDTVTVSGTLDLTQLVGVGSFGINLWSLSSILPDVNDTAANFDNTRNGSWTLVSTIGGINGFDAAKFNLNTAAANGTSGFGNNLNGGRFSLTTSGNNLVLNFTAVPEPSSAILAGLGLLALTRRRR